MSCKSILSPENRKGYSLAAPVFSMIALAIALATPSRAQAKCDDLMFSPDPVDFGDVNVGQSKSVQVTVTNPNANPQVTGFSAVAKSNPPFSVADKGDGCTGNAIAPGGTCQITLVCAPTKKGKHNGKLEVTVTGCPDADHSLSSKVKLTCNTPANQTTPPLTGCDNPKTVMTQGGSPSLAIEPGNPNNVYVTADSGSSQNPFIQGSYSTDGGMTWSVPQQISGNGMGGFNPRSAFDSAGNVYVDFQGFPSSTVNFIKIAPNWTPGSTQTIFSGSEPDLTVDPSNNNVYVSWVAAGGISFSRSTDGGMTWSTPIILDQNGFSPVRVWANNGDVAVAFMGQTSNSEEAFGQFSKNGGTTFGKEFNLFSVSGGFSPELDGLTVAGAQKLYIAFWTDFSGGTAPSTADLSAGKLPSGKAKIQVIASNFFDPNGYARTDGSLVIGAFDATSNVAHLFQGRPGGSFNDLPVNATILDTNVVGNDTTAFFASTQAPTFPGPIIVNKCHQ